MTPPTPPRPPAAILIVEDERLIARSIEVHLHALGYTVAGSARTGEEAVRLAAELRPDLILMDIHLGDGMDGIEAADRIRRDLSAPVVFLTAHSDDATLQRAKLAEPHGYVLKPFDDADLKIAIEVGLYKGRMDRRLRENEQWLAATLGSIGDGVIATDAAGRVRLVNAVAEQLTGWPRADALGRDVREVFGAVHETTRAPVPNPALAALAQKECVMLPEHTALIARDGSERPIDDSAAPILDVAGKVAGAVLVFRDVTERRRLEEHLRQAAKMEAVGRLAGGIAHDFNNMMTVVTGYSQLLRAGDPPTEAREQYLDYIHDAGRRAADLTQQILAFSRQQVLVPTVLDLNACVRDAIRLMERLVGEHIDIVLSAAANLGRVKADPSQLGQVVLNLAVNARDAMPQGGRLSIATANVDLDERATRDGPDAAPGPYVSLTVSDTGAGIPADVLPHIFEPFYTTKEVGQGTGLGLATVYGIVKQSGGHVTVESRVGAGTTFRVYLPRVDGPDAPPAAPPEGEVRRGTETVLVVEDQREVRTMLGMVLRQHGYTVLEAANGREAVAAADGLDGPIHLLLTDLVMPRMGGRDLAGVIGAARPGMRVLYMSGSPDDADVQQAVADDAVNFIRKPFSLKAVLSKVREALDRR